MGSEVFSHKGYLKASSNQVKTQPHGFQVASTAIAFLYHTRTAAG